MGQQFFDNRGFIFCSLIACAHFLLQPILPSLKRGQIGQHKLGVNYFDVSDWIDGGANMMNITVFETAHDLHDRVHLANVMEKLVA